METMTTTSSSSDTPVVALRRRTIDAVLIGVGAVLTVALVVAGVLLLWGSNFSADYVEDELSSQKITFPPAEALRAEGRDDLLEHAGEKLDTGDEAEAYASYIDGHLEAIADGMTYAELGGPEREAQKAVEEAEASGASETELARLEAEAAAISGQRNTLFKGETLRGLLLSAYAWSTVGSIALYAAIGAFVAAVVMLVLVILGIVHYRQVAR